MSLPKIKEILNSHFSSEELEQQIYKIKRQIFDLRVKQATRQSFKPHTFKHARHKLAQLLMVQSSNIKCTQNYIENLTIKSKTLPQEEASNIKTKIFKKE